MAKSLKGALNSEAAINRIKVESLPYHVYSGKSDIIPFGIDNVYPQRIHDAIRKSPTALGCIKRQSEFIFGNGLKEGGDIVVNREGQTLNEIVRLSIQKGYSLFYGFGLHVNFNSLGQECEIFNVDLEYIRKHRTLDKVDYGLWRDYHGSTFFDYDYITVDLYGQIDPITAMAEVGIEKYKGQLFYYSKDGDIYPTAPIDSAVISASFEKEAQIYPYANIKNGFSGNTIIKRPTMALGENAKEENKKMTENLQKLHGAENSGSSIVVDTPVTSNGEPKQFTMVEHLSPTNVDSMFVNQNAKAERDILKAFNMPEELLGVFSKGAFSMQSYNEAFNYKNSDLEFDRKLVEAQFNKVLENSCFPIKKIELVPLDLKGEKNEL